MNKPTLMAGVALVALIGSAFAVPAFQIANAQYISGGGGGAAPSSIEQQLKLAREKVSSSQQAGAYGSGTPMLGTSINSTLLFIIILAVIFGAISAAFFIRSRSPTKEATS
jgi:hypothetical protein